MPRWRQTRARAEETESKEHGGSAQIRNVETERGWVCCRQGDVSHQKEGSGKSEVTLHCRGEAAEEEAGDRLKRTRVHCITQRRQQRQWQSQGSQEASLVLNAEVAQCPGFRAEEAGEEEGSKGCVLWEPHAERF